MQSFFKLKLVPLVVIVLLTGQYFLETDKSKDEKKGLSFDGNTSYVVGSGFLDTLEQGTLGIGFIYRGRSMRTLFASSSPRTSTNNFSVNVVRGKVQYYDRFNSSAATSSSVLEEGKPYNLSITHQEGELEMFINGEKENLQYEVPDDSKIGWFHNVSDKMAPNNYYLGVYSRKSETKRFFTGTINSLTIWNKKLDSHEIKNAIHSDSEDNDNLLLNYNFERFTFNEYVKNLLYGGYTDNVGNSNKRIPLTKDRKAVVLYSTILIVSVISLIVLVIFAKNTYIYPKNYIKGFDGLRGISILLVIFSHLGWAYTLFGNSEMGSRLGLLLSGTTGVNVFFTLSGFLITLILLKEKEAKGRIGLKTFYVKRFLRLAPPLLLFLATLFILMLAGLLALNYKGLLYSFFYVYNYIPKELYSSELGLTWSLSVEEQFYLFWPFIILFVNKTKKIIHIVIMLMVICLILLLARTDSSILEFFDALRYVELSKRYFTNRWTLPAIATIMTGCLTAVLYHKKTFKNINRRQWWGLLVLGSAIFVSFVYLPKEFFPSGWFIQSFGTALIILFVIHNQDSYFTNALEFNMLSNIGKISYGIYIYQGLFLGTGPNADGLLVQKYPLNLFLTILVAYLSYNILEKKFLRLKKSFVDKQR